MKVAYENQLKRIFLIGVILNFFSCQVESKAKSPQARQSGKNDLALQESGEDIQKKLMGASKEELVTQAIELYGELERLDGTSGKQSSQSLMLNAAATWGCPNDRDNGNACTAAVLGAPCKTLFRYDGHCVNGLLDCACQADSTASINSLPSETASPPTAGPDHTGGSDSGTDPTGVEYRGPVASGIGSSANEPSTAEQPPVSPGALPLQDIDTGEVSAARSCGVPNTAGECPQGENNGCDAGQTCQRKSSKICNCGG